VKIRLERIDTQEEVTVEALLDSSATGLVMSSEFARKQGFKLKKIDRPIYIRNVDGSFNQEGLIEYMVEVKRMLWLAFHNPDVTTLSLELRLH